MLIDEACLSDLLSKLGVKNYSIVRASHYSDKEGDFLQKGRLIGNRKPLWEAYPNVVSLIPFIYQYGYQKPYGELKASRLGATSDYHVIVNKIGTKIVDFFSEIGVKAYFQCDIGCLSDKLTAYLGGLGFFGRNNLLINPEIGSFFVIGQVLVEAEFNLYFEELHKNGCFKCSRCIDECPSKALDYGHFDKDVCISYLTQKKGTLSEKEVALIEGNIFGCDICQDVCPYNLRFAPYQEISTEILNRDFWLDVDSNTFKTRIKPLGMGYIGKPTLIRNAMAGKLANN